MTKQVTDTIMLIRPVRFKGNEQTVVNNFFQHHGHADDDEIQEKALKEFDQFAELLHSKGINVLVIEDTSDPPTPDSIYPNNWISTHSEGRIITYPMFAENRRQEKRADILDQLATRFVVNELLKLDPWEQKGHFLEGTGSLVLDRVNAKAFVALSDRAHIPVIRDFEEKTGFDVFFFKGYQTHQNKRLPIYHTNVMMYLGEAYAVICLDCIDDVKERKQIQEAIESLGKEIIEISEEQMLSFAGNGLQIQNRSEASYIVMSQAAYVSLNQNQLKTLEKYGEIIHSRLDTIEYYGGGSARCMIAEIFLSPLDHD